MPIVYLTRRATFCASHRLHSNLLSNAENQAIFGKCNNPNGHGHNYILEVTLRGPVDEKTGMVMNVVDLKKIIEETIESQVDHRHLNHDVPVFAGINPTAENMATIFWNLLYPQLNGRLFEIKLHETENNVVVYRGEV